jgi:putative isomerase
MWHLRRIRWCGWFNLTLWKPPLYAVERGVGGEVEGRRLECVVSIELLHNRIDLVNIPFTDRGSRLLLLRNGDQLSVRLAERWVKWENEVGHYRKRPPIITGLTFLNSDGTPLTGLQVESYPHCVHVQTGVGTFSWAVLDPETLLVRLPRGRYGLAFDVYAEHGMSDFRGGTLRGKRNVAYTTNARILENSVAPNGEGQFHAQMQIEADPDDTLLLNITPRLAYNRSIPDPNAVIAAAEATWRAWLDAAPPVLEEYRAQYAYAWWIMRSGLVNTRFYFTREALLPSKVHYVGVWHWDQVFHALAYRHVDAKLAEDQLRIVLDHQREDGMLPDAIHDEGLVTHLVAPVDADVTKPPIMTWGALKLYEASGRQDFLEEIYESLTRWHSWWVTQNSNGAGLCEYRHPFSSGLDDSPLWDAGVPVVAPDLNTYLVIQQQSLAQISRIIGQDAAAEQFDQKAKAMIDAMIAQLWDDNAGMFRALHNGDPLPSVTPFNLLPLLIADLPEAHAARLVEHLTNPDLFWTPHPIPTVAINDPAYDSLQMWRGPVWININYFFVEALKRHGRHELAAELRRKTLQLVMMHKDIYEYYHPLTGERPPKAAPMFGWSASLFIELALDETAARGWDHISGITD